MNPNRCYFPAVQTLVDQRKDASEQWLRAWFRTADAPGYDYAMEIFKAIMDGKESGGGPHDDYYDCSWEFREYGDDNKYIITFGSDAHASIPGELWDHVATVLGRDVPEKLRGTNFSCSC